MSETQTFQRGAFWIIDKTGSREVRVVALLSPPGGWDDDADPPCVDEGGESPKPATEGG